MPASGEPSAPVRSYPFEDPAALRLDPYELYARLRREEPLSRVQMPHGEEAWLATRYADVKLVLGDPRFSRAAAAGRDQPRTTARSSGNGLFAMDPPEHTRLRALVAKAFTVRRVEQLRPRIQDIADELAGAMLAAGPPCDLVASLAVPLPLRVICELLGVSRADGEQFRIWAEAVISTGSLPPEQIRAYLDSMRQFMAGLVAQRRREPGDDLISVVVQECDQDERYCELTEDELVSLTASLLAAGMETTTTQIANIAYVLLHEPAAWSALCADHGLVPGAVEELMRYIPLGAASLFVRYATEDVTLGGVLVRAGEPVLPAVYSANRDETVFDRAGEVDVCRRGQPHFGFGHGPHYCLGAPLARAELSIALETLVRRLPSLRQAVPDAELPWKNGLATRGPSSLPVSW